MAPRRCPLCATVSQACGGHPSLDYKALDLMPLMGSKGAAGMTSPESNSADLPVELKEYTYTKNGMEHTAQLSEADAKKLGATATGGTIDLAVFNEKPAIEETTPGYGVPAAKFKPGYDAKSEAAPKNKAVKPPADK